MEPTGPRKATNEPPRRAPGPAGRPRVLRAADRALLAAGLGAVLWFVALLAAPATLPSGTVAGLSGHANVVEFSARWADLPPLHAAVYWVGDLICHQRADRSLALGGNQLPVDARLTGIFLALPLPFLRARGAAWSLRVSENAAAVLSRAGLRLAPSAALAALFLALLPAAVDGTVQLATAYESTQFARIATGALAGAAGGALLVATLGTVAAPLGPPRFTRHASRGP